MNLLKAYSSTARSHSHQRCIVRLNRTPLKWTKQPDSGPPKRGDLGPLASELWNWCERSPHQNIGSVVFTSHKNADVFQIFSERVFQDIRGCLVKEWSRMKCWTVPCKVKMLRQLHKSKVVGETPLLTAERLSLCVIMFFNGRSLII